MTWLSERSGMASIGVVSSAQYPQAPTSTKNAITRKRFLSDSSMSQLITHAPPRPRGRARRQARTASDAYRDDETNVRTLRGMERELGRGVEGIRRREGELPGGAFRERRRRRDGDEARRDRTDDVRRDPARGLAHCPHHGAA